MNIERSLQKDSCSDNEISVINEEASSKYSLHEGLDSRRGWLVVSGGFCSQFAVVATLSCW